MIWNVVLAGLVILIGVGTGYFVWRDCQKREEWPEEDLREKGIVRPKCPLVYSFICGLLIAAVVWCALCVILHTI